MTKAHNCSVASLASRMSVTVSRCLAMASASAAQRAERPGLRGRGDPDEDGAQHQQDQRQWRHQGRGSPAPPDPRSAGGNRCRRASAIHHLPHRRRWRRHGRRAAARHMRREKIASPARRCRRRARSSRPANGFRSAATRASGGRAGIILRAHQADEKRRRAANEPARVRAGIRAPAYIVADRAPELVGQHDQHQRGAA